MGGYVLEGGGPGAGYGGAGVPPAEAAVDLIDRRSNHAEDRFGARHGSVFYVAV